VRRTGREGEKPKTDRENLETLLEILFIVGLESGSPCLEFGFEGHFLGSEREGVGVEVVEGRGKGAIGLILQRKKSKERGACQTRGRKKKGKRKHGERWPCDPLYSLSSEERRD
jgi:hypothetical protein